MARFLRWLREWDWRPLARLMTWALIAGHFGIITRGGLAHLGRELILSWLLTFGILTYVQLLLLMSMVRLSFTLDDGSYRLAERLAKPWAGRAFRGEILGGTHGTDRTRLALRNRLSVGVALTTVVGHCRRVRRSLRGERF